MNESDGLKNLADLRVAIIHYWFVSRRGGERVIDALCELFPKADLFALIANQDSLSPLVQRHKLTTSFLQKLRGASKIHRYLLPLYPLAVEQFDLRGYDLVISQESGPAKGVLTDPETCHICYCHTPMRYIWDFYHEYKKESCRGTMRKAIFSLTAHYARVWDQQSAARVDYFLAGSHNAERRIKKYYRRDAEVIYPPVDVRGAKISDHIEDYYLAVGHLVAYKRFDLAIEACNRLGRPLRIVGGGEEYKRLRRLAGPTVSFLGAISDAELSDQYARCRALIFPGEEDFGMVPVEAQAFGRPVIAFGKGGALETVLDIYDHGDAPVPEQATGVFFREQKVESAIDAMLTFERLESRFSPDFIRSHALRFDKREFLARVERYIGEKVEDFLHSNVVDRHSRPDVLSAGVGL